MDFPKVDNLDVRLGFSTLVTDLLKLCVLIDEVGLKTPHSEVTRDNNRKWVEPL